MQNTYLWAAIGVLIALVIAGAIFFLAPHAAVAPTNTASSSGAAASTTMVNLGNGISAQVPVGAVITPIPTIERPNLNHQVSYSSSLSPDVIAVLESDIASTTALLNANPSDGSAWLQLALYYKIAGDYTAAANVWTYMTEAAPSNYIAYADLGDLYQNFLKNYPKAETNYLEALKLEPNDIDLYSDLFTLYRYQYKTNTSAATDIVAQGLAANPGNATLLQLQQELSSSTQS